MMPERTLSLKYIRSGVICSGFRKYVFIRLEDRIVIAKASFEERTWGIYILAGPQNLNFERNVQKYSCSLLNARDLRTELLQILEARSWRM